MKKSPLLVSVGRQVRLLRGQKRMSRANLADRAETAVSAMAKIEEGQSDVRLTTLDKISKGLGVSLPALLEDMLPVDKGRNQRKAVNDIVRLLAAQDEATLKKLFELLQSALALKKK
jgi:XRE family transcriptional regulator, regulator of sulfur utilization